MVINNSIKCCYNNCKKEAVGYFISSCSGLWLCKNHGGDGKFSKTTIEEAKANPKKYEWMYDMFTKKGEKE